MKPLIFFDMIRNLILVFLGGGAGSICRYAISLWLSKYKAVFFGLPAHTLLANILGCFVIGLATGYLSKYESNWIPLFLVSGFCGGFTTFSTFSLEMLDMLRNGQTLLAFTYMAISAIICIAAVYAGFALLKN